MSPYREDGAQEPSDGLTPGEREARERRAARKRAILIAAGVPSSLVLVAVVVGVLVDLAGPPAVVKPDASPVPAHEAEVEAAPRRVRGPARGRVDDFCYEGCPSHAEAWARLREGREPPTWCVVGNRAGPCNRVERGTCGALAYVKVEVDPICGGSTAFFDDAGAMVGAIAVMPNHEVHPDGGYHDPIREVTYGHVPDCDLVPAESLCVKPRQ